MTRKTKKQILVLNICKERLHYFEFVNPVEKILENLELNFYTKHYTKFNMRNEFKG